MPSDIKIAEVDIFGAGNGYLQFIQETVMKEWGTPGFNLVKEHIGGFIQALADNNVKILIAQKAEEKKELQRIKQEIKEEVLQNETQQTKQDDTLTEDEEEIFQNIDEEDTQKEEQEESLKRLAIQAEAAQRNKEIDDIETQVKQQPTTPKQEPKNFLSMIKPTRR